MLRNKHEVNIIFITIFIVVDKMKKIISKSLKRYEEIALFANSYKVVSHTGIRNT